MSFKHTLSFLMQGKSADLQQIHILSRSALSGSFFFFFSTFFLLPWRPTFICSVVFSLAVKLRDGLGGGLSGFYLLPWLIFISSLKRRTKQPLVPLFCQRRDDFTVESHNILSCVSHAIVYQRRCGITGLRDMTTQEFYRLLQWEHCSSWWPQRNGIHLPHTRGF